ncbi:MAG: discoidin domain-containing protein, partial [Actinomycetota bacterium]|nr:discoidin domain-containing protein [Actinomycetota bacterium]
ITTIHTAPASQECVDCHETADVRTIHGATQAASCVVCHDGRTLPATTQCTNCHAYSPVDTKHYPTAPHLAVTASGCSNCHSLDLKTEHFKSSAGPVSCVQCHETYVDAFTAPWDKSCEKCHPTKHGQQQNKHRSTRTDCAGSGCHVVTDVAAIHSALADGGCSACHKSATSPATTTDCGAAGCHPTATPGHHESHNAATYNPTGCKGCHFMYLDDEHIKLGMTCDTCHKSTNTLVKSAIANRDRKCLTCHPTSPHNQRQAYEFAPGNASMHRVSADLPGMRSTFYVNGGTYTWSLPPASSFLKTGYAINSMVTCDSCHTYSGADGPHGAAMKVNIDPAYPTVWTSSKLTRSGNGMNPSTIICAKCHTNLGSSNGVHNDGHHAGDYCNSCHVSIPHGWGRPRLIGYTTDPAPYKARSGGLIAMKLKNYSYSSGWNESDCYAGCDDHEKTVSPIWPNSGTGTPPPTTGTVTGRITDAATGANLSGASVSLSSGATGTSGSDGMYTLTNVIAGTYTMTVSKSGYATKTQSITVNVGQTTTANVALTTSASGGNLALGKTFTASRFESSTYAPNKAGDGDSATYWWSRRDGKKDDTEWLRVDLGSSLSVSSAEIQWFGDYFAKEFRVHTSTDGSTWVKVYETSSGSSGTKTVTFSSRMARYVRVECRRTGNDRDTGYGIAELRVFK